MEQSALPLPSRSPEDHLAAATVLARASGLFVVPRNGRFLLYRRGYPANIFLGMRTNPADLHGLVKRVSRLGGRA